MQRTIEKKSRWRSEYPLTHRCHPTVIINSFLLANSQSLRAVSSHVNYILLSLYYILKPYNHLIRRFLYEFEL